MPETNPHHERRWLILAVLGIAQLMVVLDATIVNIALPSAQRALHFSNDNRQWVVTAYALAFGSLLLLGGRIGDLFGRKWTFIGGLLGFAIASAVGGAAQSFGMLVAARAVQGAFGALLAPAALSLLTTTFTDHEERGQAFGLYGAIAGSGASVGLLLGGVLTQTLDWRFTMYVNLVFAVIATAGALALLVNQRPAERPRIDTPGIFLSITIASAAIFAVFLFLTYYMQQNLGFSPILNGVAFLPMTATVVVSAGLASTKLLQRFGPRPLVAVGMALGVAGMLYLTGIGVHSSYALHVLPSLLAMGVGFGLIFAPAMATATPGVAAHDAGVASATVNANQQVGGSIGVALLSTIAATAVTSFIGGARPTPALVAAATVHGYTTAFHWSAALFALGALVAAALFRRGAPAVDVNAQPVLAH